MVPYGLIQPILHANLILFKIRKRQSTESNSNEATLYKKDLRALLILHHDELINFIMSVVDAWHEPNTAIVNEIVVLKIEQGVEEAWVRFHDVDEEVLGYDLFLECVGQDFRLV